jgi:hypothetical protein
MKIIAEKGNNYLGSNNSVDYYKCETQKNFLNQKKHNTIFVTCQVPAASAAGTCREFSRYPPQIQRLPAANPAATCCKISRYQPRI